MLKKIPNVKEGNVQSIWTSFAWKYSNYFLKVNILCYNSFLQLIGIKCMFET